MRILLSLLAAIFIFSGCNTIKVTYDHDQTEDFSAFKTFRITEPLASLPLDDEGRELFFDAIYVEMQKKGLKQAEDADLLIDVIGVIQRKTGTTYRIDHYNAYYPYYWGPGFTTTRVETVDVKEGTIFIDVIDTSEDKLIWQGRGVTNVRPGQGNREKKIRKAVFQILTYYPPKNSNNINSKSGTEE